MDQTQFEQIIDAAILKEEEAVTFYKMLKAEIHFKGKENFLQELVFMEKRHIKVLKNLKLKKDKIDDIKPVENLGISEYLVPAKIGEDMDYKAVLELAMKKEEKAAIFYEEMAALFADDEMKKVFLKLANEEAKHKNYFEKIYDDEVYKEN